MQDHVDSLLNGKVVDHDDFQSHSRSRLPVLRTAVVCEDGLADVSYRADIHDVGIGLLKCVLDFLHFIGSDHRND